MKKFLFIVVLFLSCYHDQQRAFKDLSAAFFQWYFKSNPIISTTYGIHAFDGEMGRFDESADKEYLADLKRFDLELSQIDRNALVLDERIDYNLLANAIELMIFEKQKIRAEEWDPMRVPRFVGKGISSLIDNRNISMHERVSALRSRLKQIPRVINEIQTRINKAPAIHIQTAISQTEGVIKLLKDIPLQIYSDNATLDQIDDLLLGAENELNNYIGWLKGDLSDQKHRDFRLGKEFYFRKLEFILNEEVSPEDILTFSEWKLRLTQNNMFRLALPIYLHNNDEPVWVDRSDTLSVIRTVLNEISRDHVNRDGLIEQFNNSISELREFITANDIISVEQNGQLEVRAMPEYQQGVTFTNLEQAGPFDLNITTYLNIAAIPNEWSFTRANSFLREYNNEAINIICIREALPGHFLQQSFAEKHASVVRLVFGSRTMIDGWSHYCTEMLIPEGFRAKEPNFKITQLKWVLKVMIDTIIDLKIHTENLSKTDAIELMQTQGFQDKNEAERKFIQAQLQPCELSTYFVGNVLLQQLRQDMETNLKDEFNLKSFHDYLLIHGAIPIRYQRKKLLD